jgi:TrpR-related protein YerC/YecD
MSRFDYRTLSPKKQREYLDRLAVIVAHIRKKEDARFFLERLLTESEVIMLVRRLQIAELLVDGRTYEQIQRKLGVSMSTIRGVDRWLSEAAYEYRLIREEQRATSRSAEQARRQRARKPRPPSAVSGTLAHLIRTDSRFIIFRALLGYW